MTAPQLDRPLVDTSVMPTIHSFLRRETRLAGGVVRRTAPGDVRRAAVVDDHLEFLMTSLHHHHTVEDDHLWPLLLQKVPDELAPIVHLMESQHAGVDAAITGIAETGGRSAPRRCPPTATAWRACSTTCTPPSSSTSRPRRPACCRSPLGR